MSALAQFTSSFEQPKVPPTYAPPPAPTWLPEEPTEQPRPSAHTAPFKFVQLQTTSQQVSPYFSLPDWEEAYFVEYRAILGAIDKQIRLLERPKPREHAHEFQYFPSEGPNRGLGRDLTLNELEQAYVFEERSSVGAFIERNRIRELLLEARERLNAAFGEGTIKKLTLVEDDEGFVTLFCYVLVPGGLEEARRALDSFDESWWLAHSHEAGGKLNFDFDLI